MLADLRLFEGLDHEENGEEKSVKSSPQVQVINNRIYVLLSLKSHRLLEFYHFFIQFLSINLDVFLLFCQFSQPPFMLNQLLMALIPLAAPSASQISYAVDRKELSS